MVHIKRQSNAQAEPHKRIERFIEDSELPIVQCDYLVLKDVAATSGLKVLSMYVRTFGYGMSTVVEMKCATDTFATIWAVKMLNCLGLSDIILQCDPEPSLIKWEFELKVSNPSDQNEQSFEVLPEVRIRATEGLKTIRNSCKDKRAQC